VPHAALTAPAAGERRELPMQYRAGTVEPATFNPDAATVDVVWTTGARVRRMDFWTGQVYEEELVVTPDAVDMSRFDAGAVQVLDGHRVYGGVGAILGVATRGWIANSEGRATLKLSQRDDLAGIVADIASGVIRNVSVGYSVQTYEVTRAADRTDGGAVDLYRAVRWTPAEISFVPVGADLGAGTRAQHSAPCEFTFTTTRGTMPNPTLPNQQQQQGGDAAALEAERQRAADITGMCQRHGLAQMAPDLIRQGKTVDQAGREILDELARRDVGSGGYRNVNPMFGRTHEADNQQRSTLIVEALSARSGGPALTRENPYRHASVREIARELLERGGVNTTGMSPGQLIERAIGTTDLPNLLTSTGARTLRASYEAAAPAVKRACKPSTAVDFRNKTRIAMSEAPALLQVNENGEFKYGGLTETKQSYALVTYGRIVHLTRQALVNDDLGAFDDLMPRMGRAAAELEASTLVNLLLSNPNLDDGVAVFHANHGNLFTTGTSALAIAGLTAAVKAMRLMKGVDGSTPVNVSPAYLVVPAALEVTALQLVAQITPNSVSSVNPFSNKLQVLVDPRLDASSTTRWWLAAEPGTVDGMEYSYLQGDEGPQVFQDVGFDVDGLAIKVREDFGAGWLDYRGWIQSNGV
jgi:hypothetical protein